MRYIAVLGLLAASLSADGKVIARAAALETVDQTVLLRWKDGRQKLAIETRYEPDGSPEHAWIVPVPSTPKVTPATAGMFRTAEVAFAPRVLPADWDSVELGAALLAVALVVGFLGTRRTPARRGAVLLVLPFGFIVMALLSVTAKGTFGRNIAVGERTRAGAYDVTTVTASTPGDLVPWLEERGFAITGGVRQVLGEYLAEGWSFSVALLAPERADATRPHPLQFEFASDRPVYPMRLTGAGATRPLSVNLIVFADQQASHRSFETLRCTVPYVGSLKRWRSLPGGIGHEGLASFVDGARTVTWLRGVLGPDALREDIRPEWAAPEDIEKALYTADGERARSWSVGLWTAFVLLVALGVVGVAVARYDLWATRRRFGGACLAAAVFGAAWGLGLHATAQPVDKPPERSGFHDSHHESIGRRVEKAASVEAGRRIAADAWIRKRGNPFTGRPVVHEDSPGNYTIELVDGVVRYWRYDAWGGRYPLRIREED